MEGARRGRITRGGHAWLSEPCVGQRTAGSAGRTQPSDLLAMWMSVNSPGVRGCGGAGGALSKRFRGEGQSGGTTN